MTIDLKEGENRQMHVYQYQAGGSPHCPKHVVNDNGGTANASAWTLQANGTDGAHSGTPSPGTGPDAEHRLHGGSRFLHGFRAPDRAATRT